MSAIRRLIVALGIVGVAGVAGPDWAFAVPGGG